MSKRDYFNTQGPLAPDVRPGRVIHPPSKGGVSPVVQDGVRDSSIQRMVDGLSKGRPLPSGSRQPIYGDFTSPLYYSFHERLNEVAKVRESFDRVPAAIRAEYANDPAALGRALDDPALQDRWVSLGLKAKPIPPAPPEPSLKDLVDAVKASTVPVTPPAA